MCWLAARAWNIWSYYATTRCIWTPSAHRRIPDPTTAGDFCRRFSSWDIFLLQEAFHEARLNVWQQQPKEFFEEAVIDGDGTTVETCGECKEGMDINYEAKWSYHPLLISLANTGEPLYLVNRSGNRPSHENAAVYFDRAIAICRRAGFRRITLRGDTDFSQTEHLDRWNDAGVEFVFGFDATDKLYALAEKLPDSAWKPLRRPQPKTCGKPRERPPNVKERIVEERGYKNIRLKQEYVAEFSRRGGNDGGSDGAATALARLRGASTPTNTECRATQ